jgi:hypothetical protein
MKKKEMQEKESKLQQHGEGKVMMDALVRVDVVEDAVDLRVMTGFDHAIGFVENQESQSAHVSQMGFALCFKQQNENEKTKNSDSKRARASSITKQTTGTTTKTTHETISKFPHWHSGSA